MSTEKDKMLAGALYDPYDAELIAERQRARLLFHAFNATRDDQKEERQRLLTDLIPNCGSEVWIEPPFFCDYGLHITIGDRVFFNFNCTILDVAAVRIGSGVLFGPNVQVYAATHPMRAEERRSLLELGRPVEIGDEVWIGGGAIVNPGVRIGAQSVIGAGSVVTRDIPARVFAAGNPCRVVREL
jgi:maltose O-acetyltransferase